MAVTRRSSKDIDTFRNIGGTAYDRKSGYLDYDEVIGAGVAGVWKVFDGRRDLAPRLV
jgi:hypothetical protein